MNILDWLQGKKTYLAGIGLIVTGLTQIANNDFAGGVQSILLGIAAITGRQALARVAK
jgi:hypothetical protein